MPQSFLTLDAVIDEWNQCHGAFYQVRAEDWQQVITSQKWMHYEAAILGRVPVILGQAEKQGERVGISSSTLWVNLWGCVWDASAFVQAVIAEARDKGFCRIRFGGDDFHFVTGVPEEENFLLYALRAAGFEGDWAHDLAGSISKQQLQSGFDFKKADSDALQSFLAKEFPGRWNREFLIWRAGNFTGEWRTLNDTAGKIIGFARIAVRDEKAPIAGLRLPGADASLGPIGIAAGERGRGLGSILLSMALKELHQMGAQRLCIDWVSEAEGFYKGLGLSTIRRTKAMSLKLPATV